MLTRPRESCGSVAVVTTDEPVTVDALTAELKRVLEGRFPRVSVVGEVVSLRPASSGHLYFSLRGSAATLPAVLFKMQAQKLRRPLRDGDEVVVVGAVEVFPPHGRYQLVIASLRFSGEGELLLRFEALKKRLAEEGLFARERKRPLPFLPRRIGLVTAATGAAVQDVLRSVFVRFPASILLAPAPVQGEGAHRWILAAIRALASLPDVDVIVVARGGGSLEDLWEFNQEALARAVAECPRPVVSAVGHEVDFTLVDFVADARAATPTGVGELVVPEYAVLVERLKEAQRRATLAFAARSERAGLRLRSLAARLLDPRRLLSAPAQRLDWFDDRAQRAIAVALAGRRERLRALEARLLTAHPQSRMAERRTRLDSLDARLRRAVRVRLDALRARLGRLAAPLPALGPTAVLTRGYAIVRFGADGPVVRSATAVAPGAALTIQVSDGRIAVRRSEGDT